MKRLSSEIDKSSPTGGTSFPLAHPRLRLRYLIVAAMILHISVTLALFLTGRNQLFPSQIYPNGIGRFAIDGVLYESQVTQLSNVLKSQGVRAWATSPSQLHVRLYALPFTLVSRWVNFNILTIEPLNLIYYLGILVFVFKLGEAIFGYRTGLIAAAVVALWPSFLLHTTQLLRDPLLILAFAALVWCLVELVQRDFSWRRGLVLALAAILSIVTIRIVRLPMWYLIAASVATGVILFVVQSLREQRLNKTAAVLALLLSVAVVMTPKFQPFFHNQQELGAPRVLESEEEEKLPLDEQIFRRREAFKRMNEYGPKPSPSDSRANYPQGLPSEDGSGIDADVSLNGPGAIVRHLPRALIIGFFAPFPNMWLQSGKQVGYSGRLISGIEMFLTYVIELLALVGLWSQRKNLAAWLLMITTGLGAIALGLAVNNVGAMYRLRYPFWILMVVLGAGGGSFLFHRLSISKSGKLATREISV